MKSVGLNRLNRFKRMSIVRAARRLPGVQETYERVKNRRRQVVFDVLPKGGVGAELGVQKGYFSRTLLVSTDAAHVYLVDPWYLLGPTWHWSGGNRSTVVAVSNVIRRHRREIESGRMSVHILDDRDFLGRLEEGSLDWAYVDSSHEYAHTCEELSLLSRIVKSGGVIAGDDWQPDPNLRHHGVTMAVNEFVGRGGGSLLLADAASRQWAVQLPS
jgi:Methyltransferase domain